MGRLVGPAFDVMVAHVALLEGRIKFDRDKDRAPSTKTQTLYSVS